MSAGQYGQQQSNGLTAEKYVKVQGFLLSSHYFCSAGNNWSRFPEVGNGTLIVHKKVDLVAHLFYYSKTTFGNPDTNPCDISRKTPQLKLSHWDEKESMPGNARCIKYEERGVSAEVLRIDGDWRRKATGTQPGLLS